MQMCHFHLPQYVQQQSTNVFATKQEKASEPPTEEIICADDDGGIHNGAELMHSTASVSDGLNKAVK